jgi:GntR family transcriptional repressor for pyruvate dehydrogenase complex
MPIELNKITKSNVADTVIDQLIELILNGKLKLGEKLPTESELANSMGIGRNSVREAMKVLQVLGIVKRRQGDGSYISQEFTIPYDSLLLGLISKISSPSELVELRRMIEVGIADLVVEKADKQDIENLEKAIFNLESYLRIDSYSTTDVMKADLAFHIIFIELTDNKAIIELGRLIMKLFQNSMEAHLSKKDGIKRAVEDHRAICQALKERDREKLRNRIIRSFDVWKEYITIVKNNSDLVLGNSVR